MVSLNDDSSSVSPVSPRKRAANRRNAQQSTGPRSAEGKRRSSRNAITHGVFAEDILLDCESAAEFRRHHRAYVQRFSPQDAVELDLVNQMVLAQWRLRRCQRAETGVLNELSSEDMTWLPYPPGPMRRGPHSYLVCALTESDALERINRCEQRMHNLFQRSLRQLEQLRGTRPSQWSELAPSPYLQPLNDADADDASGNDDDDDRESDQPADANVQNEPTAASSPASSGPAEPCAADADDDDGPPSTAVNRAVTSTGEEPIRGGEDNLDADPDE